MTHNDPPFADEGSNTDAKIELVVNERAEAMVFHTKPFRKRLSWLEFNLGTNELNFVMNDGDIRDLSLPVDPKLAKLMQNVFQVLMVHMDDATGQPIEGNYFPLIVH
ncbi:MAG: hypothetical protein KDJ15_02185 [Alphaproteobacteria bacterium]|nr:hypothetical protein [Alphaproteobacteria bacterium]